MQSGIIADAIMCRTKQPISDKDKKKIAMFCNVDAENVLEAPDVKDIYSLPYIYAKQGLARVILEHFNLSHGDVNDVCNGCEKLSRWNDYVERQEKATKEITVCVAGKYSNSNDCYKSLFEAIHHAGHANDVKINTKWLDCRNVDDDNVAEKLNARVSNNVNSNKNDAVDCIIIPGGFGAEGTEGKISVIKYARENNIPLLGICLGMQLSVIEFVRNVCGLKNATSTEFDENTKEPVVHLMKAWECENGDITKRSRDFDIGGTMRLGGYISKIKDGTLASKIYQDDRARI